MLIHLVPKLYTPYVVDVRLVDVAIPELGLVLDGHKDLTIRRPFPNKRYWVACRKVGQKAIAGLLLESERLVSAYTVTTRWAINADMVLTHSVDHVVLDSDFDAVSDDMTLWYGTGDGRFVSRWPSCYDAAPVKIQPAMDLVPAARGGLERPSDTRDVCSGRGFVMDRLERFQLPTIERQRLLDRSAALHRLPSLADVFPAKAVA